MKVFIDPGHNYSGVDTGAQGNGLREQDVTFYIADKLKRLLMDAGYDVRMSREKIIDSVGSSVSESLRFRSEQANQWGANLFISIHCNSFNGIAKGTESLIYSPGGQSAAFAERIQTAIAKRLKTVNRGVKVRNDLAVLRMTVMPAVLVETAFIDNPEDAILLRDRQDDFARAIFEGVTGLSSSASEPEMELTDIEAIVWEYGYRGVVTDLDGMISEMNQNPDGRLYWLARKALQYIRNHNL